MGDIAVTTDAQNGAAQHLYAALDAGDDDEKHFHIRQALQHLGVQDTIA